MGCTAIAFCISSQEISVRTFFAEDLHKIFLMLICAFRQEEEEEEITSFQPHQAE